jgi:hypothetical protein
MLLLDKHSSQDPFSADQQKIALSVKILVASHPAETRTCDRKCFTLIHIREASSYINHYEDLAIKVKFSFSLIN